MADLFLLMVQTTPSRLFLRLPWDNERSASSDFVSQETGKTPLWRNLTNRMAGKLLDPFAVVKILD
jgi:hypothetical protein